MPRPSTCGRWRPTSSATRRGPATSKRPSCDPTDDEGRATEVEFRASALGRSTHYTLTYDYGEAPKALSWRIVRGDIMRTIDGAYRFAATTAGGTEVTYDLSIELVVPLPGFVKRRAEVRILNTLKELKERAES